MSKTYKTRPYWVKIRDINEDDTVVFHRCEEANDTNLGDRYVDVPCDVDSGPFAQCRRYVSHRRYIQTVTDGMFERPAAYREYTKISNGRDRARVRDSLRRAINEWNATQEVDEIVPTDPHRHSSKWDTW